jgi:curli biogenesis system outer membrane secretion channel CsgG
MKKLFLLMLCLSVSVLFVNAQRKKKEDKLKVVTISLDTISSVCKGSPMSDRPRITVGRFNVTAPQASHLFGGNLATMLTNYLQSVDCFQVLETKSNMSDLDDEINQSKSANADKSTKINAKQLSASYIITGEVVRYEVASKESKIMGIGNKKHTASLGIIVKITDPRTRLVVTSQNFSADKETSAGNSVSIGGLNFSNTDDQNPALQMAAEEVIKRAVIFLAGEKDKMSSGGKQSSSKKAGAEATTNNSTILITNIEYEQLSALTNYIEKIKGVKSVNSDDYSDKKATILVDHSLKLKELVDKIIANTGVKLAVSSMSKDEATLSIK